MTIALFGATGATGQRFVAAAENAGASMRLHCRSTPTLGWPESMLTIIGSFNDRTAIRETVRGSSAVVILFGPRDNSRDIFCAKATRAIVLAMRARERTRILCVTCAKVGALTSNVSMPMRAAAMATRRFRSEEQADDRTEQERIIRSSRLDWTLIKTPRLTDASGGAEVRAGVNLDIGLRSTISRDSLCEFLLGEISTPRFSGQTVYVSNL